jgi:peptidoglycan/LPS O-acetylase OafA/YrhL
MKNNLNLIRLLLAICVLLSHSYALSGAPGELAMNHGSLYTFGTLAVYCFFCLSGFLITKSFNTSISLPVYLWHRFLRIYPALWFAIIISVLLGYLGQSGLNFQQFFHNPMTKDFILTNSLAKNIKFFLPGSFSINPWKDAVNGSLWTLPLEIRMYLMVAIIGMLGVLKDRQKFNILFIVLFLLGFDAKYSIFADLGDASTQVSAFFLMGAFWYLNNIRYSLSYFVLASIISLFAVTGKISLAYLVVAGSYCILYVSFVPNLLQTIFNRMGDYSYGIYIYAFPVQQYVMYFFLTKYNQKLNHHYLFSISLIITFLFAIFSWHVLEKRCMRLKNVIIKKKEPLMAAEPQQIYATEAIG